MLQLRRRPKAMCELRRTGNAHLRELRWARPIGVWRCRHQLQRLRRERSRTLLILWRQRAHHLHQLRRLRHRLGEFLGSTLPVRPVRMTVLSLLALAGCDSNTNYPFVGQWALENPKPQDLCAFLPKAKISRAHIVIPLDVLTITDIKSDSGRWILNVTGNGGARPPVVIKEVTPQSLVLTDMAGLMACKMKKTGDCKNLLCD
jgi:hypothetical protein